MRGERGQLQERQVDWVRAFRIWRSGHQWRNRTQRNITLVFNSSQPLIPSNDHPPHNLLPPPYPFSLNISPHDTHQARMHERDFGTTIVPLMPELIRVCTRCSRVRASQPGRYRAEQDDRPCEAVWGEYQNYISLCEPRT